MRVERLSMFRMARSSARTCAAAVGAAVIGLSAPPASAGATPVPLAGVTTIAAAAAASSTRVSVARDVTLTGLCFPEAAVTFTGSADGAVLVLVPVDDPGNPVYFGRFPKAEGSESFSSLCGSGAPLKRGTYTAVLLHSPGSVAVTLRLPGLTGKKAIKPAPSTAGAKLAKLSPVAPYDSLHGVGTFGASDRLTGKGMVLVFGWLRTPTTAVQTVGDCEVEGALAELAPLVVAQAPGCPLGGSGSNIPGPAGSGTIFHGGGVANVDPGVFSAGLYYVTQSQPKSAGAMAIWLPNAA